MMELPESYLLSNQITKALSGKMISTIEVLRTPHKFAFFKGDNIQAYPELLEGKTIQGACFRGGMLEIDTEDAMIIFSDGVTPRYYTDRKQFPQNHQFALYFDDETAMICSIRMYGFIQVCRKGESTEEYYVSSLTKQNPLTDEFTYDYFRNLYPANKSISAKAFLATEQRIPGLGNGVLQDILWDAGIDPRYKLTEEDEAVFHTLYDSVRKMIRKMCEDGGRDTEQDLYGNPGGYISQLSKKSLGEPCMKCGTLIHKAAYMGGTVYFCEHCQKRESGKA